jgi:hypothetical protein
MQQVEMVIVVMRQMGTRKIDTCRTQMEEDDTDTDGDSDTDKSDELDEEENEEDVPIPCSWNHDFSLVNDGHDYSCEYHQNNVAEGGKISEQETSA